MRKLSVNDVAKIFNKRIKKAQSLGGWSNINKVSKEFWTLPKEEQKKILLRKLNDMPLDTGYDYEPEFWGDLYDNKRYAFDLIMDLFPELQYEIINSKDPEIRSWLIEYSYDDPALAQKFKNDPDKELRMRYYHQSGKHNDPEYKSLLKEHEDKENLKKQQRIDKEESEFMEAYNRRFPGAV
jgi:hypothetical protein